MPDHFTEHLLNYHNTKYNSMKSRVKFWFFFFFLLSKVEWALQLMKFNEYGP